MIDRNFILQASGSQQFTFLPTGISGLVTRSCRDRRNFGLTGWFCLGERRDLGREKVPVNNLGN
jgi:hypothetical protein